MCGIFAYQGNAAAQLPDPEILREAATRAGNRGPHGHGWVTPDGEHRALGGLVADQIPLEPRWILGHSRLATFGMVRDLSGVQPVTVDGHTLIHNGNVYNWRELQRGYSLEGATDSWTLGALYAHHRGHGTPPRESLAATLAACHMKAGAVVVRDATGALIAFRERLPIHVRSTSHGVYLSSGVISHSTPLPERSVQLLARSPK